MYVLLYIKGKITEIDTRNGNLAKIVKDKFGNILMNESYVFKPIHLLTLNSEGLKNLSYLTHLLRSLGGPIYSLDIKLNF